MSKLEDIRRVLAADPEITWEGEDIRLPYHRLRSGDYRSVGFRVAPKKPILGAPVLRKFSAELIRQLIPVGPNSVSWCSIFAARKVAIRLAALYFSEASEGESDSRERRIVVSIFPCQVMAQNVGYRAIIEVGDYECPEPCEFASSCTFKASRRKMLSKLL